MATFVIGSVHTAVVKINNDGSASADLNIIVELISVPDVNGFKAFQDIVSSPMSLLSGESVYFRPSITMAPEAGKDGGILVRVTDTNFGLEWEFPFVGITLISPSISASLSWTG